LDTHIWLWAALGHTSRFRADCQPLVELAAKEQRLFVSAASIWEIAVKSARGDIQISGDLHTWVAEQIREPGIRLWPLSPAVLIDSTLLPTWIRRRDGKEHKDPSDRFIVATARRKRAVLVTCDEEIVNYSQQGQIAAFDARP
jgi:PIN domain nuclease of toxin-antitoxin system